MLRHKYLLIKHTYIYYDRWQEIIIISTARAINWNSEAIVKQRELFNQSYEAQIMPQVVYDLRYGHTHTHEYISI